MVGVQHIFFQMPYNHSFFFNRYLYFNFRETEPAEEGDEEDYLRLKENLEVNMIDLQTRKVVQGVSYKGHKGFSEYPAWYICLDTSDDIVARLVGTTFYACCLPSINDGEAQ